MMSENNSTSPPPANAAALPDWRKKYESAREELLSDFQKRAEEGVNLRRAWYLFAVARDAYQKGDYEKAYEYAIRVKNDITRKEKLHKWSSGKHALAFFIGSIVAVIGLPVTFYAVMEFISKINQVYDTTTILGIPVFIVLWGYVGAATFVLLAIGRSITQRLNDPRKAIEYFYRLVLGGVLAGVIFYVVQLGIVSLPGTAGVEISESLVNAGAVEKYRKAKSLRNMCEKKVRDYEILLNEIEYYEYGEPSETVNFLSEHADKWEHLGIAVSEEPEDVPKSEKQEDVPKSEKQEDVPKSEKQEDVPKIKEVITIEKLETKIGEYTEGDDFDVQEDAQIYIRECYKEIQPKLEKAVKIKKRTYEMEIEGIQKDMDMLGPFMESVKIRKATEELEADILDLKSEPRRLSDKIAKIKDKISRASPEKKEELESAMKEFEAENTLIPKRIQGKEDDLKIAEESLKKAEAEEVDKPVWESAVFIVVAFFSGFSINFVYQMFDRATSAIFAQRPAEGEMEDLETPTKEETEGGA
jgi:hypothetical protein